MRIRTKNTWGLLAAAALTIAAIACFQDAQAGGTTHDKAVTTSQQDQGRLQAQGQLQGQQQSAAAESASSSAASAASTATSTASAAVETSASNEGNSLSVNEKHERSAPPTVLVPNNNTARCIKVYGFSGSNVSGSAMFGWPVRDKDCDFEAAADDAFAAGERSLGWFWKCHEKSLYKPYYNRQRGQSRAAAQAAATEVCQAAMVQTADAQAEIDYLHSVIDHLHGRIEQLGDQAADTQRACREDKDRMMKQWEESDARRDEADQRRDAAYKDCLSK